MFIRNHRCLYPLQTWLNADASNRVIWTSPEDNFRLLFWTYSSIFYSLINYSLRQILVSKNYSFKINVVLPNANSIQKRYLEENYILYISNDFIYFKNILAYSIIYLLQALTVLVLIAYNRVSVSSRKSIIFQTAK